MYLSVRVAEPAEMLRNVDIALERTLISSTFNKTGEGVANNRCRRTATGIMSLKSFMFVEPCYTAMLHWSLRCYGHLGRY